MYQTSIVTFLDILGFKNILKEKSFKDVEAILDKLQQSSHLATKKMTKTVALSDSVVRTTSLISLNEYQSLLNEITDIGRVQCCLIEEKLFIRGAISVGEIYNDTNKIFGQGLVNAYDLESKFSIYPRVIIDPAVIETFFQPSMFDTCGLQRNEYKKFLALGDDGLYFIDYLNIQLTDENNEIRKRLLFGHKEFIIEEYNSLYKNRDFIRFDSITQKYLWLIQYHNRSVKKLISSPTNSLLIDNSFLYIQNI